MKTINFRKYKSSLLLGLSGVLLSSCSLVGLDAQDGYDYEKKILDPRIGISARQLLESRANGSPSAPNDTVFRWMKKGLDYAGIDLAEYEKPGRTFIFLHNDAIRQRTGTAAAVTGGLFFQMPVVLKNPDGSDQVDPVTGLVKTAPATKWEDYKPETVRRYFMYLIGQGEFNFEQLNSENKVLQSLLPANTASDPTERTLFRTPNVFDQEGKFTLKIRNNDDLGPIVFNDGPNARTGGYVATNGIVHVYSAYVPPSRPVVN